VTTDISFSFASAVFPCYGPLSDPPFPLISASTEDSEAVAFFSLPWRGAGIGDQTLSAGSFFLIHPLAHSSDNKEPALFLPPFSLTRPELDY